MQVTLDQIHNILVISCYYFMQIGLPDKKATGWPKIQKYITFIASNIVHIMWVGVGTFMNYFWWNVLFDLVFGVILSFMV